MPPASLSGSLVSAARSSIGTAADGDAVAGLEVEPGEQGGIGGGAERVALLGEDGCEREGRVGRGRAEQRIIVVNGL